MRAITSQSVHRFTNISMLLQLKPKSVDCKDHIENSHCHQHITSPGWLAVKHVRLSQIKPPRGLIFLKQQGYSEVALLHNPTQWVEITLGPKDPSPIEIKAASSLPRHLQQMPGQRSHQTRQQELKWLSVLRTLCTRWQSKTLQFHKEFTSNVKCHQSCRIRVLDHSHTPLWSTEMLWTWCWGWFRNSAAAERPQSSDCCLAVSTHSQALKRLRQGQLGHDSPAYRHSSKARKNIKNSKK